MNKLKYIRNVLLLSFCTFLGLFFIIDVVFVEAIFISCISAFLTALLFPGITTKVDRLFYRLLEKVTGQKIDKNK